VRGKRAKVSAVLKEFTSFLMKNCFVAGSTGSLGSQVLEVLSENSEEFRVVALACCSRREDILRQADLHDGARVIIDDMDAMIAMASSVEVDVVINTVAGTDGIAVTEAAVRAGKRVIVGNKESIVERGSEFCDVAVAAGGLLVPLDSELTSLFYLLNGVSLDSVERVVLTASGGPFFGKTREELSSITVSDALNHPRWQMGPKVTVESATLMNKALEMIAAHQLFNLAPEQIDVLVHPEAIVHALVYFRDGNVVAAMSEPDMRHVIRYALHYPVRTFSGAGFSDNLDLTARPLTFHKPDTSLFRGPLLARSAMERGGRAQNSRAFARLNRASEDVTTAFLNGEIAFLDIYKEIEKSL
jgi:1-deoxy-D-xylulose-5-phosphate reductoisomerase